MFRRSLIRPAICAVPAAIVWAATPVTAAIVLIDPSFEGNNIANAGASQNGVVAGGGWTSGSGTASTYLVDNGTTQTQWFNQAVPAGQQALSLANGFITQQLNDNVTGAVMTSTVAQQFDISFYAGRRKENTGNGGSFSVILQAYSTGGAYVGDLALQKYFTGMDADPSTIDLGLGIGNWTSSAITLSLTAAANQFAGNTIRVVFAENTPYGSGGGAGEAAIDQVSVTMASPVPEPSVAILGGLGVLGLLRRRREENCFPTA